MKRTMFDSESAGYGGNPKEPLTLISYEEESELTADTRVARN
jgi:hypothetical protein